MFEALTVFVISGLVGTEIWCGYRLHKIFKFHSEERTDERRARYRAAAYREMNERWDLKQKRQSLWDHLQK